MIGLRLLNSKKNVRTKWRTYPTKLLTILSLYLQPLSKFIATSAGGEITKTDLRGFASINSKNPYTFHNQQFTTRYQS